MSLEDRIAAARDAAELSMDPLDWALVRALEAIQTSERRQPPQSGDTIGLPPWSEDTSPAD